MTFTYFPAVPAGANDPADDQPQMLTNTASISSIIDIDHVGFNTPNGGYHEQIHFNANIAAPGLGTGVQTIYPNTFAGNSWPFVQNGVGSSLMMGPTSITATADNYASTYSGYAYLAGGLVIAWGFKYNPLTSGSVTLPITLAGKPLSITLTMYRTTASNGLIIVDATPADAPTTTTFHYKAEVTGAEGFFWTVMGKGI